MNKILIIPIFVPHMGCPHTCVFCNQKKIAGCFEEPTADYINKTVFSYLESFNDAKKAYVELAFYGGSFTGISESVQEELLLAASNLKKIKAIDGIRLSTRPDYINPQIVSRLKKYGVNTVELGVQSLDNDVLISSQRGHSIGDVEDAVELLKKSAIQVGIQLMPGLPQDSVEKMLRTTQRVIELKPHFVRIYPTVVIKETQLAKQLDEGLFEPLSLENAIEVSAIMFIMFSKAGIPVIRLGLQATDNLIIGKDLLAGPFHPAFGELVKSRVFRKQLEYLLAEVSLQLNNSKLFLFCNRHDISQVKGQKKANIIYFREEHNLNFMVKSRDDLDSGSIALEIENSKLPVLTRREFLNNYRIIL